MEQVFWNTNSPYQSHEVFWENRQPILISSQQNQKLDMDH